MAKNKKLKKRWTAGFLAVLAAFLAIAWQPLEIRAEEVAQSDETVLLEGIEMDKTNLVMKTGEQKTLRATLLPENTTEQPEIQWSSDDTDVVEVEGSGNEAVVRAPDGHGGTAIITVTAGNFTATCKVLVIVQDPLLESIVFMQNSSGSNRYALTEGLPGSNEFTLRIPESTNVLYARPQLRDDVEGAITATFTDVNTGQEITVDMPVDEATSLSSNTTGRIIKAYDTEPKELVVKVTAEGRTEIYQVHIVRGTYLANFNLTDGQGEAITYSPEFKKTVYEYSVHVPSSTDQICIDMTPAETTSTYMTVNGEVAEDGKYVLELQEDNITAVLCAGDGAQSAPYEYILTVFVDKVCRLKVNLEPEDAVFSVYDSGKVQLQTKDGFYELIRGNEYTYTVSKNGYQTQNGTITLTEDGERTFTLDKTSDSQLEDLEAEWGGYWKNDNNQNIVDAMTPSAPLEVEVLWKQQYGSNADYSNSVSDGILVDNYICCFSGSTLMYLDKNTGEMIKSVKMAASGNSSFTKPLYAAGTIFVPLSGGKLQAFNAKTLESLWIYKDTIGGNASAALRYDSGYLYAAFADGNLVCLSVTDEDPDSTNEEKSAVWRKFDSKGYYRTGVYTNDNYLFAGSYSSNLYCLNKKTGETLQKDSLPSEAGAISTGICYENGRIYFATENGYLYSYGLTETGMLDLESKTSLKLGGAIFGTPLVYNNRIYVGTASKDKYGVVQEPYYLNVVQVDEVTQGLSLAYQMETEYGAKGSGTLTTAYEKQDGYVYVYFTTDSSAGSLYLLKDKAGLTSPGEGSGLFYQQHEVSGAGSGSVLADSNGNLYFRYESAWMFALQPTGVYLEGFEISGENVVLDGGREFDGQAEKHDVVLDSGSDWVTLTFHPNEGTTVSIDGTEGNVQDVKLIDGRAEVTAILTKGDKTRRYLFSIRQRSADVSLEMLQVSYSPMVNVMEMELEPAFDPECTDYRSSIFGTIASENYYIWPKLPKDSASTMKVTAISGVSGVEPGGEIKPMPIYLGSEERLRYKVSPSENGKAEIMITVTAEDGKAQREYTLSLSLNNDLPTLTADANALMNREEKSVTVRVNANMDGYLYYLSEKKSESDGIPSASVIRKDGKRIAIQSGQNVVTLDGFEADTSVLYLYEMSYGQRFSNGIQIDVPAYTPLPVDPAGMGDLNGDGKLSNADVIILLNGVTEGLPLSLDVADMNGDGKLSNADVIILLNLVTQGG